ncbi:hypothetical protein HMPREF1006_01282 [Synergistes sp. 3_1_syn1]|nr:hypothetical protein HMPREF1006_01282 [Synergistes sp. 3_1_syn1]
MNCAIAGLATYHFMIYLVFFVLVMYFIKTGKI